LPVELLDQAYSLVVPSGRAFDLDGRRLASEALLDLAEPSLLELWAGVEPNHSHLVPECRFARYVLRTTL
jgi:hypothetical protein